MRLLQDTRSRVEPDRAPSAGPAQIAGLDAGDHVLLRAMAAHLLSTEPKTDAEALRLLRDAFPQAPLAARVAALAARTR